MQPVSKSRRSYRRIRSSERNDLQNIRRNYNKENLFCTRCNYIAMQYISRTERTTHGTRLALYAMPRECTAHRTHHAWHSVRTTRTTHGTHYARHALCTAFSLHYARQTLRTANTMNGSTTHNTHCAQHTNLKETRHRTRCTFRIVRDEHGNRVAHDKHCARAGHDP